MPRQAAAVDPRSTSSEPRRLEPDDPVPAFRSDLTIEKGASAGLFDVTDPVSGRRFTLYEFELSIARMLDGRRHASDVIEGGLQLGIPVDLDGLYKFVRQLWWYGFLAAPGGALQEDGSVDAWGERNKWDEATRTLFQTGLRLMRQGRPQDARGYFLAVLDADPENADATTFLAAMGRGEHLTASPIGRRDEGTATASGNRWRRWLGGSSNRWWAVLAAGVMAASGGAVVALLAKRPPQASAPAVPTAMPPSPPERRASPAAWHTAAVRRLEHPVLEELAAPAGGLVFWKVKGTRVTTGRRIGTIATRGVRNARRPDPAAEARIKELEALAAKDPVYRDFLEKERRASRRKRLAGSTRRTPLTAPATGSLVRRVRNGTRVERGEAIATVVDDSVWVVEAFMDGETLGADAGCELKGDAVSERIECKLDSATARDGGSQLMLTIPAASAPWLDPSRPPRVRVRQGGPSDAGPREEEAP